MLYCLFFSLTVLVSCAAVGSSEDKAGKCFISHASSRVDCTSIHSSLCAPGSMRMTPCSLHAGYHSSRHWREDLHAISNVRYDLTWRSLLILFKSAHVVIIFCLFVFFLLKIMFSLRRLCPIWNANRKSHMKTTCSVDVCLAVQKSINTVTFGDRWNETLDLFCPKISSYSLVSSTVGHWPSSPKSDCGVYHYMAGTVNNIHIVKPLHLLYMW